MINKGFRYFCALILILIVSVSLAADIEIIYNGRYRAYVTLQGTIEPGDARKFASLVPKLRAEALKAFEGMGIPEWYPVVRVGVNSKGGSVDDAIAIGRLIRENKFGVTLRERAVCYSSCIYLYAASQLRDPLRDSNNIGIHRPYFTNIDQSDVDKSLKQILETSRRYFVEMNVRPSLADEMFSIDPRKLKILSKSELIHYRLYYDDIALKEKIELDKMKRFNMSREELIDTETRYWNDVNTYCDEKNIIEYWPCKRNFAWKHGLVDRERNEPIYYYYWHAPD